MSVTAEPATATGFVAASVSALPPTFTANADAAGTGPACSASLKVSVSVAASIVADETVGGVPSFAMLLVTALSAKSATAFLPLSASCSFAPVAGAA